MHFFVTMSTKTFDSLLTWRRAILSFQVISIFFIHDLHLCVERVMTVGFMNITIQTSFIVIAKEITASQNISQYFMCPITVKFDTSLSRSISTNEKSIVMMTSSSQIINLHCYFENHVSWITRAIKAFFKDIFFSSTFTSLNMLDNLHSFVCAPTILLVILVKIQYL